MDEGDIGRQIAFFLMEPDDAAVDFKTVHMVGGPGKRHRQGTEPHAYLHDDVRGSNISGPDNRLGSMSVDQEVLAESFARGEFVVLQGIVGAAVSVLRHGNVLPWDGLTER